MKTKKLMVALTVIALVVISVFSASAETNKKEWTKMTGPAEFSTGKDGVTVKAEQGVSFYKYTKDTVDITDFTCSFKLEQDNYWLSHDEGPNYYYSMILTNKAAHSGSQGLFLLLFPTSGRSLRIEGQILNTGFLLSPTFVEFDVDTTGEMVMHGKVIDNKYYEISFDNCKDTYKFEIPINYQFHKDLDGRAFFGFGGTVFSQGDVISMTVSKVNDNDFTGSEETGTATSSQPTTTDNKTEVAENNNNNNNTNTAVGDTTAQGGGTVSTALVVMLTVGLSVLFLVAVAGFVFLIILINRKFPSVKKDDKA